MPNVDRYTFDLAAVEYTAPCDRCGLPCRWRTDPVLGSLPKVTCPECDPVQHRAYLPARTGP